MMLEHLALLATIVPAIILGMGWWGVLPLIFMIAGWGVLFIGWPQYSGKFVCGTFVLGVVILFIYFFPVWTAIPIERSSYYARMWLERPESGIGSGGCADNLEASAPSPRIRADSFG